MRVQLIALTALLVGCAGQPTQVYIPVEVKVPVKESCITEDGIPVEPSYALSTIKPDANILVKGIAALQEIEQRREWQSEVKTILKQCIKTSY